MKTSKEPLRGITTPIALDRSARKPFYQQIYDAYRTRILRGDLHAGELVPSSRELGRQLRVSRLPVLNAYSQLLAEGYFESRIGAGTFIAAAVPGTRISAGIRAIVNAPSGSRPIAANAAALPKYQRPSWAEDLGPFQVGQPALQDFPMQIWSRLVARHSRRMKVRDLQYGNPMGSESLRQAIASYLRTARAVRCEPGQIMVVSGSQQALDISTRVLLNAAARVWVEEPGYWLVHHVLKAAGCRAAPVPVDMEGISVEAGIKLCRNARAVFVAPSHQYPLGVTMTATRRLQLLEWAEKSGAWIIEDDYDSEYRYDSMPIASLQGLDTHSRVLYVGTFSKVLFPSLRVGYIVIPRDLVEHFAAVRQACDLCPSQANQEVLASFIREGHFSRHIRRMRRVYEQRRRVLVEAINGEFDDSFEMVGAEAGLHVTLLSRHRMQDVQVAERAAQHGLWVTALSLSYTGRSPRQGFVLGFGNTRATEIPGAVRLLKNLCKSGSKSS
jgi:GntR family transcriptional regulator/MocR family aminotransferase